MYRVAYTVHTFFAVFYGSSEVLVDLCWPIVFNLKGHEVHRASWCLFHQWRTKVDNAGVTGHLEEKTTNYTFTFCFNCNSSIKHSLQVSQTKRKRKQEVMQGAANPGPDMFYDLNVAHLRWVIIGELCDQTDRVKELCHVDKNIHWIEFPMLNFKSLQIQNLAWTNMVLGLALSAQLCTEYQRNLIWGLGYSWWFLTSFILKCQSKKQFLATTIQRGTSQAWHLTVCHSCCVPGDSINIWVCLWWHLPCP